MSPLLQRGSSALFSSSLPAVEPVHNLQHKLSGWDNPEHEPEVTMAGIRLKFRTIFRLTLNQLP
jgi:hypothetical protein